MGPGTVREYVFGLFSNNAKGGNEENLPFNQLPLVAM